MEILIDGKSFSEIYRDKNTLFLSIKKVPAHKTFKLFGDISFISPAMPVYYLIKTKKTGELSIKQLSTRKTLFFHNGKIINASSTDPADQIENLIIRRGLLTKEQIDTFLAKIPKKNALSKYLVENKLLTPRQLFELVHEQAEGIIFSVINSVQTEGNFIFFENSKLKDETYKLTIDMSEIIKTLKAKIDEL